MRKIVVLIIGSTVLLIGIAMILLPGPAFILIPLGIAILSLEFKWAQRVLDRIKNKFARIKNDKGVDK